MNPPVGPEGNYPLLHENVAIGAILKSFFGYNGNPSLLEVISYVAFLSFADVTWILLLRRTADKAAVKENP